MENKKTVGVMSINTERPTIPFISIVFDEYEKEAVPPTTRCAEIAGIRIGTMKRWLREMCVNTENGLPATTRLRTCPLVGLPMQGSVAILHILRTYQNANALKSTSEHFSSSDKRQRKRDVLESLRHGKCFELPQLSDMESDQEMEPLPQKRGKKRPAEPE